MKLSLRSVCLVIVSALAWTFGTTGQTFAGHHHHHHGSCGSSGGSWGSCGSSGGSYGSYGSSGGSYGSHGSSGGSHGSSGGSWGSHGSSGGSYGSSGSSGGTYSAPAQAAAPSTVSAQNVGRAWMLISVPQTAVVYIENQRMSLAGTERQFFTPPLAADKEFVYTVRVDVPSGDRIVSKVSNVKLKVNRNVRFTVGRKKFESSLQR